MVDKKLTSTDESGHATGGLVARLSRNMTARRHALGLTQAQVAERLSLDTETVSRFERGKHVPSLATLERLASVLVTSVADLLAEESREPNDNALIISSWMEELRPEDRRFAQTLLKQCCDYLAARNTE